MINDLFVAGRVAAADMDLLWAQGWRHFGVYFFRYSTEGHDAPRRHVIPLRVDLTKFALSRSQSRVMSKNRDLQVIIRDTHIDAAKEALFERHSKRFEENVPDSLHDFLSAQPSTVPCRNREICVYQGEALLAMSFLDIGNAATSAVYAAFDPVEHRRSLGIFTMLCAIQHSRASGARYYYPGYAFREPSRYDYKKRFAALEFLDWTVGWKPFIPS